MFSRQLLVAALAVSQSFAAPWSKRGNPNLEQSLRSHSDLSTFVQAAAKADGLLQQLANSGVVTVFAPTNGAFDNLHSKLPDVLESQILRSNDKDQLTALLKRHVVSGDHRQSTFEESPAFLNSLLIPGSGSNSETTKGEFLGVKGAHWNDATVIATSLDDLPRARVVDVVELGDIKIVKIDQVLRFAPEVQQYADNGPKNLKKFAQLWETIGKQHNVDLKDTTIFIPTDEAFGLIEKELNDASDKAKWEILQHHVVKGVHFSSDFGNAGGDTVTSIDGKAITISSFQDGKIFANGGKVIQADAIVNTGAVHIIDEVLNPWAETPKANDVNENAPPQERVQFRDH